MIDWSVGFSGYLMAALGGTAIENSADYSPELLHSITQIQKKAPRPGPKIIDDIKSNSTGYDLQGQLHLLLTFLS